MFCTAFTTLRRAVAASPPLSVTLLGEVNDGSRETSIPLMCGGEISPFIQTDELRSRLLASADPDLINMMAVGRDLRK